MSDRRLSVRIDPKLHKLLRKTAKASGRPSDLSTNKKYMEGFGEWDHDVHRSRKSHRKLVPGNSQPSCLALLLAKTRFVGSAKGLPPDTSTNPAYMEGFGKDPE